MSTDPAQQDTDPTPVVDVDPADHPDVSGDPELRDDRDGAGVAGDEQALDDHDLQAAREPLEGRDDPESLATDRLLPDVDDDTWEPPQEPTPVTEDGYTPSDEAGRETLDDRVAQEEPEPDPLAAGREAADHDLREV
ncbi:hypothetical protein [Thalassiella azotivora]